MSSLNYISPDDSHGATKKMFNPVDEYKKAVAVTMCKKKYCNVPYSRFSVKLKDIPWDSRAIPNTTSLPKLC